MEEFDALGTAVVLSIFFGFGFPAIITLSERLKTDVSEFWPTSF